MPSAAPLQLGEVWDAVTHDVPELRGGTVHLWQRRLYDSEDVIQRLHDLLSADEHQKAARYRVERPRTDFILTRGTLRSLLATYLHKSPREITFQYTEYGKPSLRDSSELHFNVSHTEGMALMAFVRRREVGVDIEKVRAQSDVAKLAERFFSPYERHALRSLEGDELPAAFFRCWTRKEAYIKAKGEGLSLPLHQFDVAIDPDPAQALVATRPDSSEVSRWLIRNIPVISGYAAAVAVSSIEL